MSKSILAAIASFAVLAFAATGISLAQSGSKPSGTPKQAAEKMAAAQAPKVIALTFYADWCPGCQELQPKLTSVMQAAGKQPCLFVKLDQTDKDSRQAEFLLASLGFGELWKENGGHTGFALLVEPKSKRVVGKITADQTPEAMKAQLMSALGG